MAWLRRRHRELDERVDQAQAERELSEQRLEDMRSTTEPLIRRGEQNQFAEIIRRSLRDTSPELRHRGSTA